MPRMLIPIRLNLVVFVLALKASAASFVGRYSFGHKRQATTSIGTFLLDQPQQLSRHHGQHYRGVRTLLRDKKDDSNDGMKGMEDAFRELENLESLDDTQMLPDKKVRDEAFAKAMADLDLQDIVDTPAPPSSPEKEVTMYKDMVSELESSTESGLYEDVLSDMDENAKKSTKSTIPEFDPNRQDNDEFMKQALEEAILEAKAKGNVQIDTQSLMNNDDLKKEIEDIFDNANEKLLEGLEEIRSEQQQLAKQSADASAQRTKDKMEEDDQRLAMAQANMAKMLERVNQETKEVEKAVEDLRKAQEGLEEQGGVVNQLSDLRSGGFIKQGALVGAVLFTARSAAETFAFLGGDSSHLVPAAIQGVIAIACIAALFVL